MPARMRYKPSIGGPDNGRPVGKPMGPKKGRIKPMPFAPTAKGEGKRNYLLGPKAVGRFGKRRANKPWTGPGKRHGGYIPLASKEQHKEAQA